MRVYFVENLSTEQSAGSIQLPNRRSSGQRGHHYSEGIDLFKSFGEVREKNAARG